jgi:hypothetical protein
MPERIRLRRTKGWRKPACAVVVARPSRWGNPFRVGGAGSEWYVKGWGRTWRGFESELEARQGAVNLYRDAYSRRKTFDLPDPAELRGLDLACWCPLDGGPCHADLLLEWANS